MVGAAVTDMSQLCSVLHSHNPTFRPGSFFREVGKKLVDLADEAKKGAEHGSQAMVVGHGDDGGRQQGGHGPCSATTTSVQSAPPQRECTQAVVVDWGALYPEQYSKHQGQQQASSLSIRPVPPEDCSAGMAGSAAACGFDFTVGWFDPHSVHWERCIVPLMAGRPGLRVLDGVCGPL